VEFKTRQDQYLETYELHEELHKIEEEKEENEEHVLTT
jgi:hypothetical protein